MTPFRLALLSLVRHRFTTGLGVVAIALTVALAGLLFRSQELARARFTTLGQGGTAIVGAKAGGIEILLGSLGGEGEFPDFIPETLFESLRAEGLKATPFVIFARLGSDRVVGTDDTFPERGGVRLQTGGWPVAAGEVVLGAATAARVRAKIGDVISARAWLDDAEVPMRVSGVLAPTGRQWDRTAFANVVDAREAFAKAPARLSPRSIWGPRVLHYFLVDLPAAGYPALASLINRRTVAEAIDVARETSRLEDLTGLSSRFALVVGLMVIVLGGLGVLALVTTRFEALRPQLAVLRALGYTRFELTLWLYGEGLMIAAVGVGLGAIADAGLFPVVREALGSALPSADLIGSSILSSAPIWESVFVAVGAACGLAQVRLTRVDAHDALKGL